MAARRHRRCSRDGDARRTSKWPTRRSGRTAGLPARGFKRRIITSSSMRVRDQADHPSLLDATLNNVFLDRGRSAVRVTLVPVLVDLESATRESVMDKQPWIYRRMADELSEEGKSAVYGDVREYLYVDAKLTLTDGAVAALRAERMVPGARRIAASRTLPSIAMAGCALRFRIRAPRRMWDLSATRPSQAPATAASRSAASCRLTTDTSQRPTEVPAHSILRPARCGRLRSNERGRYSSAMNGYLIVARRRERLLDRPRAHPAHQVQLRAGLVVRARRARAAERLLADHRAGRLVVDVEVAGRVAQRAASPRAPRRGRARTPRRSAHTATSRSTTSSVSSHFVVRIDVRRHDRAEDLLAQQAIAGILRLDQRRLDEVALVAVARRRPTRSSRSSSRRRGTR